MLTEEDDHLTQLQFDELQYTFEVFKSFYKEEWKKAKRYIRREVLRNVWNMIFRRGKKAQAATEQPAEAVKTPTPPAATASQQTNTSAPQPASTAPKTSEAPVQAVEEKPTDTQVNEMPVQIAEETPTDTQVNEAPAQVTEESASEMAIDENTPLPQPNETAEEVVGNPEDKSN